MTGQDTIDEARQGSLPGIVRLTDQFGGTGSEAIERGADISPCGRRL